MFKAENVTFEMIYNKTFSIRVFEKYTYLIAKSPMSKHELVHVMTSPTVVLEKQTIPVFCIFGYVSEVFLFHFFFLEGKSRSRVEDIL